MSTAVTSVLTCLGIDSRVNSLICSAGALQKKSTTFEFDGVQGKPTDAMDVLLDLFHIDFTGLLEP